MKCDIVIPVWNLMEITKRCVESIVKHTSYPYCLIIIDNGSEQPTKEYLESLKTDTRIKDYLLIRNERNLGAAPALNQGMRASTAPYILLLNNDTIVTEHWLSEMIEVAESDSSIGIVNPDSNNLGLHAPKRMPLDEFYKKVISPRRGECIEVSFAIGFCYLMKRELLEKVGCWSEEYLSGNYEETEHCVLARKAGYRFVIARGAYVFHEEHATFKEIYLDAAAFKKIFDEDKKRYEAIYGRTKRALFVVSSYSKDITTRIDTILYEAANSGIWVDAFLPLKMKRYVFKKHGWIRLKYIPKIFLFIVVFVRSAIKKKKYDDIYVDDKMIHLMLQKTKNLHKSEPTLVRYK